MPESFQVAGGSVAGKWHQDRGGNNQDYYEIVMGPQTIVGVVADGCGSSPHSEVGAYLGARMLANTLYRRLLMLRDPDPRLILPRILEEARLDLLAMFRALAGRLNGNLAREVRQSYLFTLIGLVLREGWAATFSLGDGYIFINGNPIILRQEDNCPPYLGYGLIPELVDMDPALFKFHVHQILPLDQVDSILIATDGIADLIAARDKSIPGKAELVGDVSLFWTEDRFFANPDAVSRRLRLINRDHKKALCQTIAPSAGAMGKEYLQPYVKAEKGLLHDDTTLVVVRRMP